MISPRVAANWYIGTMGFSYADWSGVFYPTDLPQHKRLSYYSRVFNAVEVDSTFYGTPRPASVRAWAAAVPPDFRFSLKVPRQLTHEAGLVGIEGDLLKFIDAARLLGEKLGVLLFQFPPSFGPDRLPVLQACLAGLPGDVRYAVEIRHPSWYTAENVSAASADDEPALAQALRPLGVCWAATEYPDLPRRIYRTADFLYLRWIGQHGTFKHHSQERIDRTEQLQQWQQILQDTLAGGASAPNDSGGVLNNSEGVLSGSRRAPVFGFFNNDYAGFAAGTANRFKELAGLPVTPFLPPQQATLF